MRVFILEGLMFLNHITHLVPKKVDKWAFTKWCELKGFDLD